jgi:hypothetical protein
VNPICIGCGKEPHEIPEYVELAEREEFLSPRLAVINEEGTYNPRNGHFWCTTCYISNGMPLGKAP